jgi:cytochrome P450
MKDVLEKSTHRTVFQELIEGNLPPAEKNSLRLQGEASVVVAAGVVTTGWALSTAAFHIINNPSVFQTLRAELEAAIPDPDVKPRWTELEKLPYLAGCVRECVRMSYGVTAREPRLLSKPLEYKGWVIPARTPVSMTNVDVCDDETIFPDPRVFRPERWIGSPKAPNGQSLERYYVGFGKGTRSCLGIK